MKFPRSLPDIRDEMNVLAAAFRPHLDPEEKRDFVDLEKRISRLSQLAGALTEAIVDQARSDHGGVG